MAVTYCAYLFDIEGYQKAIRPMIEQLVEKNYQALHSKATEIAHANPQIWKILKDYRYFPDDLGREEQEFDTIEGRVNFWMTVVLSAFWHPIKTTPLYVSSITETLHLLGDDEFIITKLTIGKTLYALLQPEAVNDPIIQRHDNGWPSWSGQGLMGWLDRTDINELLTHLLSLQKVFTKDIESHKDNIMRQYEAYQGAIEMLSIAEDAGQGLFMAILD
jgi:hypothetical protein